MRQSDRMPLDEALKELKNFIVTLEKQANHDFGVWQPFKIQVSFFQTDEGSLVLNCEESREYRRCLDALSSSKGVVDRYSRKAVEKLMQTAILKTLDIKRKRHEEPFQQRLTNAIKELKTTLTAAPKCWRVHMRVEGLAPDGLPQRFGNVEFYIADEPHMEQLQSINAIIDSGSSTPEKKRSAKARYGQCIEGYFRGFPMASLEVQAGDSEAAFLLARRELRLTMDVINFYSDILYQSGLRVQLYSVGELQPTKELSVLVRLDRRSCRLHHSIVGPLQKVSFGDIDPEGAKQVGFYRASNILEKNNRSKVEERILASLQWAGRATVDQRPEEAFLHFAIALECITLGRKQDVELSYRLSMRTALLAGNTTEKRQEIKNRVRDLYDIRSKIVHSGHYEVADADLKLIRFLAKKCILRILTEEPFLSMDSEEAMDKWFDDVMLSHPTSGGLQDRGGGEPQGGAGGAFQDPAAPSHDGKGESKGIGGA